MKPKTNDYHILTEIKPQQHHMTTQTNKRSNKSYLLYPQTPPPFHKRTTPSQKKKPNNITQPRTAHTEPQNTKLVTGKKGKLRIELILQPRTRNWNFKTRKDPNFSSWEAPDLEDRRRRRRAPLSTTPCDRVLIYFFHLFLAVHVAECDWLIMRGRWAGRKSTIERVCGFGTSSPHFLLNDEITPLYNWLS